MPHLTALLFCLCCAISQAATITGKVVSVADGDTITVLDADKIQHKIRLSGMPAWLVWLFAHIYFLIGFRNRIIVMPDWAWAYFSFQHYARIVIGAWKSERRN